MEPHPQLNLFLEPYSSDVQKLTLDLRAFILAQVPRANELIWDNYNAVAIAYSKSEKLKDAFCHIAVYSKHVNFGFNRGAELTRAAIELKGKGKLIRHLTVKDFQAFPKQEVKQLLLEAVEIADQLNPALVTSSSKPKSLVMSISEKKIRPGHNA